VNLLLDTHVLLWAASDVAKLSSTARNALRTAATKAVVSAASVWEIAIKRATGKLDAPDNLFDVLDRMSLTFLPVEAKHAWAVQDLPPLHSDPFDRLLVTQAKMEDLTLMTRDKRLADYGVAVWIV
jgi:PIN domain nuclease of toxin-antitoxin system